MNAAVIGYGKSGAAARRLLELKGADSVDVFDDNTKLGFRPLDDYKNQYDITVVSPGINRAKYKNIPSEVTSEIELAYEYMPDNAKIIAVTGTNGKSTTTHLTAQILNNMGYKAVACGNIGVPFAESVIEGNADIFVIELSSFQIELLKDFKTIGACIINITPDHLDRYGNMDNYRKAKIHLLPFIDNKGLFICDNDKNVLNKSSHFHFKTISVDKNLQKYPVLNGNMLDFGKFYCDLSKFHLFGLHNKINLSFALLLASSVADIKGDITPYIENLTGMPHRTELVGIYNNVSWINDSKGTNVDSVITALSSISKPSYLLLGGRDKKSDYTVLKDLINSNVTEVCYFGEAAPLIREQLSEMISARQESFNHLEDAVKFCSYSAKPGSTVILSPACTSFDEFKNYEERGEQFAAYVHKYAGKGND